MVRYGPDDDKEAKEIHTENNKEENQTKTETNPEEISNKFDQQRKQDDLDESKSDNNDENIDEKLKWKQTKNISDLKGNKNDDQIDNLLRKQDKLENQIKKLKIMFMFFTIFLVLLASMLLVSYNTIIIKKYFVI